MSAEPVGREMKFMNARSFIDTNVLIYAFAETGDTRHAKAYELVSQLLGDETATVSVQVLREFYAVATRKLAKPLPGVEAVKLIRDLCHACRVLDDTLPQLERAVELAASNNFSIWDASIIAAAESGGCAELYTEDLASGTKGGNVRISNPFR
jgi:predicted nucleic acid-binding protein